MKSPDRERTLTSVRSRLDQLPEHEKVIRRARMSDVIASVKSVPSSEDQEALLEALDGLLNGEE